MTKNQNNEKPTEGNKKVRPPLSGFAIVADFWLWGALLLLAPVYFNITSNWKILFNALGFLAIIISFAGALTELSKIWKQEAFSYFGVSLVFILPAILIHIGVTQYTLHPALVVIGKIAAMLLVAVGGALLFQGIPYLFWKKDEAKELLEMAPEERKEIKRKATFEAIASISIVLLSLATAVVKLIIEISP